MAAYAKQNDSKMNLVPVPTFQPATEVNQTEVTNVPGSSSSSSFSPSKFPDYSDLFNQVDTTGNDTFMRQYLVSSKLN